LGFGKVFNARNEGRVSFCDCLLLPLSNFNIALSGETNADLTYGFESAASPTDYVANVVEYLQDLYPNSTISENENDSLISTPLDLAENGDGYMLLAKDSNHLNLDGGHAMGCGVIGAFTVLDYMAQHKDMESLYSDPSKLLYSLRLN